MSVPTEPADRGVIHDIGYRHYTGPRLGRGYLLRSLFLEGLLGAYGIGRSARSKIVPMLLLAVMCAPALIFVVITAVTNASELPGSPPDYAYSASPVILIYLATQAPAAVSRDLRFRVLPLYLSRPMSRADYVLAKVLGMATAIFVLIALPLTILYVGALLAKLPFGEQTLDLLAALVGAVLLAAVLAVVGLLIASVTPRRGFGIAAVVTVLLVLTVTAETIQAVMQEAGAGNTAGYAGLLDPFALVHGVQAWALRGDPETGISPSGHLGGLVFLLGSLALAAGCYGLLLLRYRKVSAA